MNYILLNTIKHIRVGYLLSPYAPHCLQFFIVFVLKITVAASMKIIDIKFKKKKGS